jgi:hypothetical protein
MSSNVPNPGAFEQQVGQQFADVRDSLLVISRQHDYIISMGGVAFMTAQPPNGLGMASADAQALLAALGNHAAVTTGYNGGPAAPVLDYRLNAAPFWGGI